MEEEKRDRDRDAEDKNEDKGRKGLGETGGERKQLKQLLFILSDCGSLSLERERAQIARVIEFSLLATGSLPFHSVTQAIVHRTNGEVFAVAFENAGFPTNPGKSRETCLSHDEVIVRSMVF